MANWYVKRGSETAGPLTRERIKELANQGKIQENDLVRKGEDGNFVPAGQIPNLIPDPGELDDFADDVSTASQPAGKKKSSMGLILIILIGGGFCLFLVVGFLAALLLPAVQQARTAARMSQSKNNMKQIGLALWNYHDNHRTFPPGGTTTSEGKSYHSWQTVILPYIEEAPTYNRIDFNQPWDAPANKDLFRQKIQTYLNPNIDVETSPDGLGLSHYVGNALLLKENNGLSVREITDGTSNTILAVEAGDHFKPWGDPTNIADPSTILGSGKTTSYPGGNMVLLSDGSVHFISEKIDPQTLRNLSSPNDGNIVGEF